MTLTILSLAIFGACTSDDGGDSQTSQVSGAMRYHDAATNSDGTPREAEAPPPGQNITVTVEMHGTGVITGLEPDCTLDGASGQFRALFDGSAQVDENGAYVAAIGSGDARIETLTGCAIPDLTVNAITDVVVRAELEATTASCETYCAADARADAEAECAGSSSEAECRATAESTASARCQTECTSQRTAIVAEASLAASLLGELDADALRAAAFGELAVDLTFDHME